MARYKQDPSSVEGVDTDGTNHGTLIRTYYDMIVYFYISDRERSGRKKCE